MLELEVHHDVDGLRHLRFASARQDIEDHFVVDRACCQGFANRALNRGKAIVDYGGQDPHEAPVGIIAPAQLAT